MEVNVQNINENVGKLMTDNLKESGATEKADEHDKNKLGAIMEDLNLIEKLHSEAAKEFNRSWEEIQVNQSKIKAMLKRPGSITTFIYDNRYSIKAIIQDQHFLSVFAHKSSLSLFITRIARLHDQ